MDDYRGMAKETKMKTGPPRVDGHLSKPRYAFAGIPPAWSGSAPRPYSSVNAFGCDPDTPSPTEY
jgi:hypothetical protein